MLTNLTNLINLIAVSLIATFWHYCIVRFTKRDAALKSANAAHPGCYCRASDCRQCPRIRCCRCEAREVVRVPVVMDWVLRCYVLFLGSKLLVCSWSNAS